MPKYNINELTNDDRKHILCPRRKKPRVHVKICESVCAVRLSCTAYCEYMGIEPQISPEEDMAEYQGDEDPLAGTEDMLDFDPLNPFDPLA